ncbi:helix-turn-helix domain-containing protein [Acidisphaera sp. S103]|uniref:helix-turn-helix domain-containing protein n=1 Tax=Acidisphaera sp. S103 TaxID=1747223 RepID=UPI00352BFEC4
MDLSAPWHVPVSCRLSVVRPTTDTLPSIKTERLPMSNRGDRLRLAMEARGVRKQHALAFQLQVHESAITRWKANRSLSLDNAVAVCSALDISLDWLLLGRGTMDFHKVSETKTVGSEENYLLAPFKQLSQLLSQQTNACLQALIFSLLTDVSPK